jgi:hypothetical protein
MAAAANHIPDIPMECRSIEELKEIRTKRSLNLKYPDFTNMPTPAYLVVGSSPFEPRKGRDYYDDEHYYMIDKVGEISPNQRYIKTDITDNATINPISIVFCKKFDVIVFDHSVAKFIIKEHNYRRTIQFLMKMLKPDGLLIIDGVLPGFAVANAVEETRKYYELYQKTGYHVEFIEYSTLIENSSVARKVYGPLFDNLPPGSISPTIKAIVLRKPMVGGGKKRKSRRNKKAKRSQTRRR